MIIPLKTFLNIIFLLFTSLIFLSEVVKVQAISSWTKNIPNPVITGTPGCWDSQYVIPGKVLKEESTYKMWYSGKGNTGGEQIGYAYSNDGITWIKNCNSPVISVGNGWDSAEVKNPTVIKEDDGSYKMWFMGHNGSGEKYQIGYATSEKGLTWEKSPEPVFSPSEYGWDNLGISNPEVLKIDGTYYMWYSAVSKNSTSQRWKIGLSTSSTGTDWNHPTSPILVRDQSWELVGSDGIAGANVIYENGVFKLWYHASGVGYAESSDSTTWKKYDLNPVLRLGSTSEWDSNFIISPIVIHDNTNYKMWYAGQSSVNPFSIGLAETDELPEVIPPKPPEPTETAIIVIPGFGASINWKDLLSCNTANSNDWKPINRFKKLVYDPLLDTLTNGAKLAPNKDVYFYSYDWRQNPDALAENFKKYLDKISKDHKEGVGFKVVGHSLGGLVVRSFNEKYPDDNRIVKVLTAGTPHKGSVMSYPAWEKGDLSFIDDQLIKFGMNTIILNCQFRANFFPLINNFREINPQLITFKKSKREIVQSVAPIIKSILPVFDFIKKNGATIDYMKMTEKNDWLINHPINNPEKQKIKVTLSGNNRNTLRFFNVIEASKNEKKKGDWIDGKVKNSEKTKAGDDTVLMESSGISGIDQSFDGNHMDVISSKKGIEKIIEFLDLPKVADIKEAEVPNLEDQKILLITADADLEMTLIRKGEETQKSEDNALIILNPTDGEYNLTLKSNKNLNTTLIVGITKKGEDVLNKIIQVKLKKDKKQDYKLIVEAAKSDPLKLTPR